MVMRTFVAMRSIQHLFNTAREQNLWNRPRPMPSPAQTYDIT